MKKSNKVTVRFFKKISFLDRYKSIVRTKERPCAKFQMLRPDFKILCPIQNLENDQKTDYYKMNERRGEIKLVQIRYPILGSKSAIGF